jgi:hypothetical protein
MKACRKKTVRLHPGKVKLERSDALSSLVTTNKESGNSCVVRLQFHMQRTVYTRSLRRVVCALWGGDC